jgi:hypothetical protein
MRPYNRWLFYEHFELVLTISSLYKSMPVATVVDILNLHFPKPAPPPELASALNQPPWSKYDLDSLAEDFRLLFSRLPATEITTPPPAPPTAGADPRPT